VDLEVPDVLFLPLVADFPGDLLVLVDFPGERLAGEAQLRLRLLRARLLLAVFLLRADSRIRRIIC
jgi:hypothetical protein